MGAITFTLESRVYFINMDKEYIENYLLRKDGNLNGNLTRKLDETIEELYCIYHDIDNPLCECGKKLSIKSWTKGFRKFCSPKCQKSSRKTIEKANKTKEKTGNISKSMKKLWKERSKKEIKAISENRKVTNMEKYRVENVLQHPIIREKIKKTNIERYGFISTLSDPIVKEKIKKTNIERYGTENVLQSSIVREKIKKTNIERYGVENVIQSPIVKEKIKKTNIENGLWYRTDKPYWEIYRDRVHKLTYHTYNKYKEQINPLGLVRGTNTYHLDHKFSIKEGFENNIPIHIIASIHNLEILKAKDNWNKTRKCSITLEDLLSNFTI